MLSWKRNLKFCRVPLSGDSVKASMKRVFPVVFTLLFAAPFFLISCQESASLPEVTVVAHRGAMMERPENTMPAFERALETGADIVEIDLRTSRDGVLYILHDATLDRTTSGAGEASERSFEELRALDAGSWFDPAWSGERIPSFRDVLEWAFEREVRLLLDLKEQGEAFADRVSGEVIRAEMEDLVVVGVRSVEQAREFRSRLPDSPQLGFMGNPQEIEAYAEAGVDVIRLWLGWLEEEPGLAARVRETGRKLMVNGNTGEPEQARALLSFEPDWILIDDPAQLYRSFELIAQE